MGSSMTAGDGSGVVWFPEPSDGEGLLKSILPLWSDHNVKSAMHAPVYSQPAWPLQNLDLSNSSRERRSAMGWLWIDFSNLKGGEYVAS